MKKRGFTFVEVTAAVAIGAFIMMVAVGALKSVSDGIRAVREHSEMDGEMRFVVDLLRSDLENLYRDTKPDFVKMVGGIQASNGDEQGSLSFYTVLHQKARAQAPEGDVYEVEYGLMESEDKAVFVRRLWPNPDKEREPGGIVTVLSERIVDFRVRFFNGQEWLDQWSEQDNQGLPELIEVQLVGQWNEDRRPVMSNFMVNFVQGQGTGTMEGVEGDGEGEASSETGNEAGNVDAGR